MFLRGCPFTAQEISELPGFHWRNKNGHKWINHAVRVYTHTRNMNSSSDHLALEEFEKCWLSYFILCFLMAYIGLLANLSTVWDVGGDMRQLSYSLFNLIADNEISKSNQLRVIRVARSHKKIIAQNWLKKFTQNIFPQYFSRVHTIGLFVFYFISFFYCICYYYIILPNTNHIHLEKVVCHYL